MDYETKELVEALLQKYHEPDTNHNYDVKDCNCNCSCSTNCEDEITIKLSLDTHEAVGAIEELSKKLQELPENSKVLVFNNCVFQFGKQAMNTNYHKPVDNDYDCNCCED